MNRSHRLTSSEEIWLDEGQAVAWNNRNDIPLSIIQTSCFRSCAREFISRADMLQRSRVAF